MTKRNFILLIIVLMIVVIAVFGFLYLRPGTTDPGDTDGGTNFFSQFNPFGTKTTPPVVTPPVNVPSDNIPPEEIPAVKLTKVSSMPIAGFTVFSKERLKEVPIVTTPPQTLPPGGGGIPPATVSQKTKKLTPPATEFMPALRYVDRATGNIYQTFADKIEERKFSGT